MYSSSGTHGALVYVLAHARAHALAHGVAFISGPDHNSVAIAMVGDLWSVTPASFFPPTWINQVQDILNTHGLEGAA